MKTVSLRRESPHGVEVLLKRGSREVVQMIDLSLGTQVSQK